MAKTRVRRVRWCTTSQGYLPVPLGDDNHPIKIFERMRPGGNFISLVKFISVDFDLDIHPVTAFDVYEKYIDSLGTLSSGHDLGEVRMNGEFRFDLAHNAGYAEMSYWGGRIHIEIVRVGNDDGDELNEYLWGLQDLLSGS